MILLSLNDGMAIIVELYCFYCLESEQAVDQIVELSVICRRTDVAWCRCNAVPFYGFLLRKFTEIIQDHATDERFDMRLFQRKANSMNCWYRIT